MNDENIFFFIGMDVCMYEWWNEWNQGH